MRDWSAAVRRPTNYRVTRPGFSLINCNSRLLTRLVRMIALGLFGVFVILLATYTINRSPSCPEEVISLSNAYPYNSTYPLTPPIRTDDETRFRIAIVTDLDWNSKSEKDKNTWFSYFRYGTLSVKNNLQSAAVAWEPDTHTLKSTLAQGGRSMELSDLTVFNGALMTVDDRTGVIYRIENPKLAIPWVVLQDGPGNVSKGFKAEWMTVKDKKLYVGGLGKEWTTIMGEYVNDNPMWVKRVSHTGFVEHLNWTQVYRDLRAAAGIYYPGYMIHESARWSEFHQKWFFFPRRASKDTYTEEADERRGTNYMLIADPDFKKVEARQVGELVVTRGFSAFSFVPGTHDNVIVALKSEEDAGTIASYISVFTLDGKVLLQETKLNGAYKYEGVEFV